MSKSDKQERPERKKEKAGEIRLPERKKNQDDAAAYKTEDQLKAEARERQRIERLMAEKQKPKSAAGKKAENFWYHYRGAAIAAVIGAVMLALFVKDVFFKAKPDITIVMVTAKYVSGEYLDELTSAIEAHTPDINGDGKVYVSVDHIPYFPVKIDSEDLLTPGGVEAAAMELDVQAQQEQDYNYLMKLMTVVAASTDPIYLLDQENFEYLNAMGEDNDESYAMFESLEQIPGGSGYALPMPETIIGAGDIAPYFDELSFYFRSLRITDKTRDYNEACMSFLEGIAKW